MLHHWIDMFWILNPFSHYNAQWWEVHSYIVAPVCGTVHLSVHMCVHLTIVGSWIHSEGWVINCPIGLSYFIYSQPFISCSKILHDHPHCFFRCFQKVSLSPRAQLLSQAKLNKPLKVVSHVLLLHYGMVPVHCWRWNY